MVQLRLPTRDGIERQIHVELHLNLTLQPQVAEARIIYATTDGYGYAVWKTERILRVHELLLVATTTEGAGPLT